MSQTSRDGGDPEGNPLSADQVRQIVLVRAFEEADPEGRLLPLSSRRQATQSARKQHDSGPAIAERASQLSRTLSEKFSSLGWVHRLAPGASMFSPVLFLLALAFGFSLNALGPARQINALSFPLLLVIAWNLVVYALLLIERLRGKRPGDGSPPRLASLFGWFTSPERFWRKHLAGFEHEKLLGDALHRFGVGWWQVGQPLHRARIEGLFHAASAMVAIGTVLGMYVRGLALQYHLSWESTFLDQSQVQSLVSAILAPADMLLGLGTELPLEGETVSAAPWIHQYAMLALLFVILPRLVLMLLQRGRARKLEAAFPLNLSNDGYFLRLMATDRGEGVHASLWSYSYQPSKLAAEGLQALLLDVLGNRARLGSSTALEYGAEWEELVLAANGNSTECIVLLFNAAQSPEQEVHGHFLEGARASLESGNTRVLVLVDESRYASRLGEDEDGVRRLGERRRAWERLARESGFRASFLSLEAPAENDDIEAVRSSFLEAGQVLS